jgi:hypothetical protein
LWVVGPILCLASHALASNYEVGESYTGFKFGLIGSGSVDRDGQSIDQGTGLSAGVFFDQPFGSKLHYGLSADFHRMSWRREGTTYGLDDSGWLLDIGLNLKGNLLGENSRVGLRPGVGIGGAFLGRMESVGLAGSSYLTLKGFTEVIWFSPGDLIGLIEIGVWYAPSGGDHNSDLSLGPLWLLRGGVMF